jgi:GrpB-like predicted nucleotidyltransferase (UPF0157 family)
MLINPSRPEFKKIFLSRKKEIRKSLGAASRIEHFGSTAVSGLPGKGVIDIIVGFRDRSGLRKAVPKLVSIGYVLSRRGQKARGGRVFLSSRKGESEPGDVHVHLVLEEDEDFKKSLRFRDRLRRSKAWRERYIRIKKEAARAAKGKRKIYTKLKHEFIEAASRLT